LLADVACALDLGCRVSAVVTTLTAQNSTRFVASHPTSAAVVSEQLHCILEEEKPDLVKVGALGSLELGQALAGFLAQLARDVPSVVDPVAQASLGAAITAGDPAELAAFYIEELLPLCTVATPNLAEAEALLSERIEPTPSGVLEAARHLAGTCGCSVVVKGGDADTDGVLLAWASPLKSAEETASGVLRTARLAGTKRGTGCRFATSLAVGLARGARLEEAVRMADCYVKSYLSRP
jgi:hydroxymethylpyrimidine/phosphomethylpyrimidine kinase